MPPTKKRRRWRRYSAHEDGYIMANYATTKAKDIGAELGRSAQSIRLRAAKLGVCIGGARAGVHNSNARWTDAQVRQAVELYEDGQTLKQVAEATGIPISTVHVYVRQKYRSQTSAL